MDSTTGTTTTWTVDPNHTDVAFSVRHMGLSTVRGRFGTVSGAIDVAADGRPVRVSIDIDVATIATGSADRDGHLVSADFFDAANHPTATFVSRDVRHLDGDRYEVEGDLTMHGITKPVVLDA